MRRDHSTYFADVAVKIEPNLAGIEDVVNVFKPVGDKKRDLSRRRALAQEVSN